MTNSDDAKLSPQIQQLVQSTIHACKINSEKMVQSLKVNDVNQAITHAVNVLKPLARDGIEIPRDVYRVYPVW